MAQRAPQTTVNLPTLITREATFLPETVNEDERTVEIVWTTGARVLRGYWDRYWEELSLDPKHVRMKRINNGAPLLTNHCGAIECVIGVIEEATLEAKRGRGKVRFAKAEDDPEADKVFRKVKDGILQNISVGYQVFKMEKVEDGADKIPVYRAVDWEPYEFSVVAMGADDGAGFRSQQTSNTTPCVFVTRTAATATRKATTMDDEETPTPAPQESPAVAITRQAHQSRAENARQIADAEERAAKEALAAERVRITGIRSLAKRTKLGSEWADKLIEAGVSIEDARKAAIDGIVDEPDDIDANTGLRISAGDDARDKFVRGASAWILEHCGKRSLLEQAAKKAPSRISVDFDSGNQFRGMSPFELARESLERAGVKTRGMNRMELLGRAFTHRGVGQTTGDFPLILESALHKVLLGAYETQETTWPLFCGDMEVVDFRPANRYRTGALASLPLVEEHGEYKNSTIPDAAKFAVSTERHGSIFSLSREVIINDDMGALANLAAEFGSAAADTIEDGVYALLAENGGLGPTMSDGQPFFHANRANVNAVASALTVLGLDADRVVMRAQKDPSNRRFLSLSPHALLVPDSLYGTARVLNDSAKDPDANTKLERKNIVFGLFREIVGTPRLAAASTRRYLFTDPSKCAALVVAFLQGYGRGPIMESRDGWRVDGVEWKVTQYAKPQVFDPKGAVTNAGA
jgi:HK97 family phage prohead protease